MPGCCRTIGRMNRLVLERLYMVYMYLYIYMIHIYIYICMYTHVHTYIHVCTHMSRTLLYDASR